MKASLFLVFKNREVVSLDTSIRKYDYIQKVCMFTKKSIFSLRLLFQIRSQPNLWSKVVNYGYWKQTTQCSNRVLRKNPVAGVFRPRRQKSLVKSNQKGIRQNQVKPRIRQIHFCTFSHKNYIQQLYTVNMTKRSRHHRAVEMGLINEGLGLPSGK